MNLPLSDTAFRWSILVSLAVIACSLYVLSTMTVVAIVQRRNPDRLTRYTEGESDHD